MESGRPTAAVYAGSLARTYEYRTMGVPILPHLGWSFVLPPGVQITCPLLVAQDRVYIADSAGFFSALDTSSGDLVWSFPTDWVEVPENPSSIGIQGVTAACLDGALGYVASACGTLYELDLSTGQVVRLWHALLDDEEVAKHVAQDADRRGRIRDLFVHRGELFLIVQDMWGQQSIFRFHLSAEALAGQMIDRSESDFLPSMCEQANGGPDILFTRQDYPLVPNTEGCSQFAATALAGTAPGEGHRDRLLWSTNDCSPLSDDPLNPSTSKQPAKITGYTTPVMDGVLYALASFGEWDESKSHPIYRERLEGYPFSRHRHMVLLALDPQNGVVHWRVACAGRFDPFQLVAASHQLFLVAWDRVESLDVQTHQRRWTWKATFLVSHALVADGLLYVLGRDGEITALEAATGVTCWEEWGWEWEMEGEIFPDGCTIDDGTLYFATYQALYALRFW